MKKLSDLQVGDEVVVSRSYSRTPPTRAKVNKVGRTLLYVEGERDGFYIATGESREAGFRLTIRTVEQAEYDATVAMARQSIEDNGVQLKLGHSFTDEQILALAAAVKEIFQK